jgi:peptidoglycan/LPS O-acetylase OafA/YrhL
MTERSIAGLDTIRAFSVAAVIVGHGAYVPGGEWMLPFAHKFDPAGIGVTVFFGLSGYLITGILLRAPRIDLADFYRRRAFRILPAAFTYLAFVAAIVPMRDLAYAALFARNFEIGGSPFAGHYWSLAVEEQFYLFWPAFLVFVPRRAVVPILAGWLVALPFWVHFTYTGNSWRTDLQSGALTVGCLLAFARYRPTPRLGALLIVAGLVLTLFPRRIVHGHGAELILAYIDFASVAALIAGAAARGLGPVDCAPLRWIGRLSYSLYLWQQFWVQLNTIRPWAIGTWPLCIAPIMACGIASYYLIERPMLRLRDVLAAPAIA